MEKPWYRSKITLLGIVMGLIGITDLGFGWLTGQGVTAEQIQAVQTALPNAAEGIKDAVEGKNYFGIITAFGGFITAIFRVWWTNTTIA